MKKTAITILKAASFFLVWAVLGGVIPLIDTHEPALWRLWAEFTPLLAVAVVTLIFWGFDRNRIRLHLFDNPIRGFVTGIGVGTIWLALPVGIMYVIGVMRFGGKNTIELFPIWILAVLLNVMMQELLVRGYMYQLIKQRHNSGIAAIVTTAVFTFCHGGAFEAGIVPISNVITMSLLMTLVLEYTGSLIAPTVMHFIWNCIGALVLGGVSLADDYPNLFITVFSGNVLLSGGVCKIEGSIVVLLMNLTLGILLFIQFKRSTVAEQLCYTKK